VFDTTYGGLISRTTKESEMAITERPTLDQLAELARTIASNKASTTAFTYFDEDYVRRRIACGAMHSRSSHSEIECIAATLLEAGDGPYREAGVALSGWFGVHVDA
jgi:hypothetical protein